jgi:thiamine-phosphate pyrophosphorylase
MRENFPRLYVILDSALLGDSLARIAEVLAHAGVTLMQLRNKTGTARATFEIAQQLVQNPAMWGVRLIINDRPDIAARLSPQREIARGTHVGQDDLMTNAARILCPPPMWIGISTHNLEQVREADDMTADYVALGPIFHTKTKAEPYPLVGLGLLREVREATKKPLVAIGGITAENAAEAFAAGADSVAVARDIVTASDPGERAREFLRIAEVAQRF